LVVKLLKSGARSRKLLYGLIAVILVECIIGVSFFVVVQSADLKQNSFISKAKATAIAMPLILQYAMEHQRIITGISATLGRITTHSDGKLTQGFYRRQR
jgi:hypothetical protein